MFSFDTFFADLKDLAGESLYQEVLQRFNDEFVEPAKAAVCRKLNNVIIKLQSRLALFNPVVLFLRQTSNLLDGLVSDLEGFELVVLGNRFRVPSVVTRPFRDLSDRLSDIVDLCDEFVAEVVASINEFISICEV